MRSKKSGEHLLQTTMANWKVTLASQKTKSQTKDMEANAGLGNLSCHFTNGKHPFSMYTHYRIEIASKDVLLYLFISCFHFINPFHSHSSCSDMKAIHMGLGRIGRVVEKNCSGKQWERGMLGTLPPGDSPLTVIPCCFSETLQLPGLPVSCSQLSI